MIKETVALEEEKLRIERLSREVVAQDIRKVSTMFASDRSSSESSRRSSSSSNPKDTPTPRKEDQLESTKAEMGVMHEENKRLKLVLARIVKDYESLQTQLSDIIHQEQAKISNETTRRIVYDVEEPELVCLRLGTSGSKLKKNERLSTHSTRDHDNMEQGLTLGLGSEYQTSSTGINDPLSITSHTNTSEETRDEEMGEPWQPSKILKNLRNGEDESSEQETHVKKARVSVRARCDAPTMDDGCQWRKYGQKIAKRNPCPRAYYRCTVAPACPVRKQVQRCAEDMSILISTYEGTHNHPLPISATAMASTTSADACMQLSGSSASGQAIGSPSSATTASCIIAPVAHLNALNFGFANYLRSRQFYLPNPTISSNPCHPTITLDLTAPLSSTSEPSQFSRFLSPFNTSPRYPSPSFNFSSTESPTNPMTWGNGYLSHVAQPYNKNHIQSLSFEKHSQDIFQKSYMQKARNPVPASPSQHLLTDTIAKAITADPNFQSALTAAITSYVGAQGAKVGEDGSNLSLKLGERFNLGGSFVAANAQASLVSLCNNSA